MQQVEDVNVNVSSGDEPIGVARHDQQPQNTPVYERKSFWKQLAPWSGYRNPISFWKTLISPIKMLRSPVVLWSSAVYMTSITWIVVITIVNSQIFSQPPYNFHVSQVGLTFLALFVGSIIGTIVARPTIDGIVKLMALKNNGTFGESKCLT